MCTVKTPKVSQTVTQAPTQKPVIYMRNAYLDGLGSGAEQGGRNSLRVDMGSRRATAPGLSMPALPSTPLTGLFMGSAR